MADPFLSVSLEDILAGEPLPVNVYVFIDFRFILFRAQGDAVDRNAYDRLEFKKAKTLFINDKDRGAFEQWANQLKASGTAPALPPENKDFGAVREDVHRQTMDIFQSQHPDKMVAQLLTASKKLVNEVMKFPYAVQSLSQLQSFSKGTVDHSVNVSVLSVYLAMQMGYAHQVILQHVGMGGLLHDIGKTKVKIPDGISEKEIELKMRDHVEEGIKMLDSMPRVPNEVKLIVGQHHEANDGTGFPNKLRGGQIYDLARIVAIANIFDELVGEGKGTLVERQRGAIQSLDQVLYKKFDPQKLDKALKILKLGV